MTIVLPYSDLLDEMFKILCCWSHRVVLWIIPVHVPYVKLLSFSLNMKRDGSKMSSTPLFWSPILAPFVVWLGEVDAGVCNPFLFLSPVLPFSCIINPDYEASCHSVKLAASIIDESVRLDLCYGMRSMPALHAVIILYSSQLFCRLRRQSSIWGRLIYTLSWTSICGSSWNFSSQLFCPFMCRCHFFATVSFISSKRPKSFGLVCRALEYPKQIQLNDQMSLGVAAFLTG